jgi:hypothetical protein
VPAAPGVVVPTAPGALFPERGATVRRAAAFPASVTSAIARLA